MNPSLNPFHQIYPYVVLYSIDNSHTHLIKTLSHLVYTHKSGIQLGITINGSHSHHMYSLDSIHFHVCLTTTIPIILGKLRFSFIYGFSSVGRLSNFSTLFSSSSIRFRSNLIVLSH